MKIYKILATVFVFAVATTYVGAQNSKYSVSKYTLTELANGSHNTEVVNKSGMTGKQVYDMLESYTKKKAGVSLPEFVNQATEVEISEPHYNTQATKNGLQVYFDRTPQGHKKVLKGAEIKVECCNLVSSDPGVLKNFLANYAQNPSQGSETTTIRDDDSNNQNQNQKEMDTQTQAGLPGWAVALIILALVGLFIIAIIAMNNMENKKNNRDTAVNQVLRDQNVFGNNLFGWVSMFENAKSISNMNAAQNAQQVHQTWQNINPTGAPTPVVASTVTTTVVTTTP